MPMIRTPFRPRPAKRGCRFWSAAWLLLAAGLAGQQPQVEPNPKEEAAPEVPVARPLFELHLAAPAAWRAAFLPTNLGAMLAGKDTQPIVGLLRGGITAALAPAGGDSALAALMQHEGALDLAVAMRGERAHVVLRWEAGAQSEVKPVVDLLTEAMRALGEPQEVASPLGALATVAAADDVATLPFSREGDVLVVMAVGSHAADEGEAGLDLETAFAVHDRWRRERRSPVAPPLRATLDLPQLVDHAVSEFGSFVDAAALRRWLGGDTLGALHVSLAAAGPQLQLELSTQFGGGDRGVFEAVFPDAQGVPAVLGVVPPDCRAYRVGQLRLDVLYESLVTFYDESEEDRDRATIESEMRDSFGVDLGEDLLRHLTGEIALLWGPGERLEIENLFDNLVIVLPIANAEAFARAWRVVVPEFSPGRDWQHSERDGIEFDAGHTWSGDWMCFARAPEMLCVGLTDGARELLEQVLDRRSAEAPAELPPPWPALQPHAPRGLNGLAETDVRAVLSGPLALLFELLDEGVPPELGIDLDPEAAVGAIDRWWPLLQRHALDRAQTMTGYRDGRWVFRVYW